MIFTCLLIFINEGLGWIMEITILNCFLFCVAVFPGCLGTRYMRSGSKHMYSRLYFEIQGWEADKRGSAHSHTQARTLLFWCAELRLQDPALPWSIVQLFSKCFSSFNPSWHTVCMSVRAPRLTLYPHPGSEGKNGCHFHCSPFLGYSESNFLHSALPSAVCYPFSWNP